MVTKLFAYAQSIDVKSDETASETISTDPRDWIEIPQEFTSYVPGSKDILLFEAKD